MNILVVGATGATGSLLVKELLEAGEHVKAVVRSKNRINIDIVNHKNLEIIEANILDLSEETIINHLEGCDVVASCLGHNLTFKGIFGKPRRLVTDVISRLCRACKIINSGKKIKFLLMNTTGNSNRDLNEKISFGEKIVLTLLRLLLPPHVDNEKAADFLRLEVPKDDKNIEWVAIRPDTLIDNDIVTEYKIYPSPIRSAIFNAGITSRINVANFMKNLIIDNSLWDKWKGQMPVIYNRDI